MAVGKWLKRKMAIISLAMAGVEKNALGQNKEQLDAPVAQERRHNQGTLADSLKQGKITQEVMDLRWRTYKVLQASEGVSAEIIGYDEDNNPITRVIKTDKKRGLSKVKMDDFDKYNIEMVVDNTPIVTSGNDMMDNDKIELLDKAVINYNDKGEIISATHGEISGDEYYATKGVYPITIVRDGLPKFDIETYAKKLYVKIINKNERLLEFHISKYPDEYDRRTRLLISEIKKAMANPRNSTLLDIKEVGFITYKTLGANDFLQYNYKVTSFDKIIDFNGHYVIKFKADIDINGINIVDEFRQEALDAKYENKEKKKQ